MSVKRNHFHHLKQEDRDQIDVLAREGYTQQDIAKRVKCHTSTVCRELLRNVSGTYKQYVASIAQSKAIGRRCYCVKKSKFDNDILVAYIKSKLKEHWSPEQIAGRLGKDHPGMHVSHEAIYQYIYSLKEHDRTELIALLTRSHKTRKRNHGVSPKKKTKILNRVSIAERPAAINDRKQPGHWETDTIVCKSNTVAIDSTVERVSRLILLSKLNRKNSINKARSVIRKLSTINKQMRLSITYDNGTENAAHTMINNAIGTVSYFAHPYRSWERGSNENANGLVRRFIPKGTDLHSVTEQQLVIIENKINNRPRKCLNYCTSYEVASSLNFFEK